MKSYRGKKTSRRRISRKNKGKKKNTRFFRGGSSVVFPPTFLNTDVSISPQSYLPYNNFANDPGYSVVNSSNTGPFLTGVSSGGSKKHNRKHVTRRKRLGAYRGGSNGLIVSNPANNINNPNIVPLV